MPYSNLWSISTFLLINGETHIPESLGKFDGGLFSDVIFSAASAGSGKLSGSENNYHRYICIFSKEYLSYVHLFLHKQKFWNLLDRKKIHKGYNISKKSKEDN